MRIDKIFIKKYKNLNSITIDFDEKSFNSVVIGKNGTGKSNLLEAITIIFRNLSLQENINFDFEIDYNVRNTKIRIVSKDKKIEYYQFVEGAYSKISKKLFYQHNYIPNYVFGYYSGVSDRFQNLFQKHDEIYRDQLIHDEDRAIRPLFWASPQHAQFVLLAFYLDDDPKAKEFLKEYLDISEISSIDIQFKEPEWTHPKTPENLWGAEGAVLRFFKDLYDDLGMPVAETVRKKVGMKKHKTYQTMNFKIEDLKTFRQILGSRKPKDLFRLLESTLLSDLLEKIDVKVNFSKTEEEISFFDFSEGQKQILTVLGLLRFTNNEDSLFLLDEPDTQLNPKWAKNYLKILREYAGSTDSSQLIMTTHSPIVFSGLEKSEVIILKRDINGNVVAENPDTDPKGLGFSSILTSEFFEMDSTFDTETYDLIKERRVLLSKKSLNTSDKAKLQMLNKKLFEADYTSGDKDELYKIFLRKLNEKRPELFQPNYTSPPTLNDEMNAILDEVIAGAPK